MAKGKWSEQEDAMLLYMVEILSNTFSEAAYKLNRVGQYNPGNPCQLRYKELKRKQDHDKYRHTRIKVRMLRAFVDKGLQHQPHCNTLELFCGGGWMTRHYAKYGGVLALDVDPGKVEATQEAVSHNKTVIVKQVDNKKIYT